MVPLIILVPAYNELANLKKILKKNKKLFLVIDDYSSDNTQNFLKNNKISYIRNKKNLGYEKSLIKGLSYLKKKAKYVCTVDGDGEHPINKIKKIYFFAKKNKIDLVICNRKNKNRLLENILSFIFWIRFGLKDPLSGMKMYYMPKLKKIINQIDKNSFLVDIIINFIVRKYKVYNYEILTKKKIGSSKVGYGFNIQLKILKLLRYVF